MDADVEFGGVDVKFELSDASNDLNDGTSPPRVQVDKYPQGYPQFAAVMASREQLLIVRRFSCLRMRLLLQTQDRIAQLEGQLEEIDNSEKSPGFLRSIRQDENSSRQDVLSRAEEALAVYDDMVKRAFWTSRLAQVPPRHAKTVMRWFAANDAIDPAEIGFLHSTADLASLGRDEDLTVSWLEYHVCRMLPFRSEITARVLRTMATPLEIILFLLPIILASSYGGYVVQVVVVVASFMILGAWLTFSTKAKTDHIAFAVVTIAAFLLPVPQ